MNRFAIAVLWGTFVFAVASWCAAQSYTVTDLGALKGDNESSGFAINDHGEVAGCSDTMTIEGYPCTGLVAGQHAFTWSSSVGMKDLGTLSGASVSGAVGLNNNGSVVGYSNVKGQPATNFVAILWSSTGAMTNLGTLSGGSSSGAFQISSSGVIVGDSFTSSGIVDATTWTGYKIKSIGTLPKAIFTAGLGINGTGSIVGESVFSYGPPFTSHGFLWTGLSMEDLGTLPSGVTSIASAINTSGEIAGQSDGTSTGGLWHAVLWDTAKKIHDLGALPGGTYSVAFGINDLNQVVGYGNISNNAPHALLWSSANGMQDLNSLIPSNSGWVLINANAINKLGQITGYGSINGYNHAFLLTPLN